MVDYRLKASPIEIINRPTLRQVLARDLRRLGRWIVWRVRVLLRCKSR